MFGVKKIGVQIFWGANDLGHNVWWVQIFGGWKIVLGVYFVLFGEGQDYWLTNYFKGRTIYNQKIVMEIPLVKEIGGNIFAGSSFWEVKIFWGK